MDAGGTIDLRRQLLSELREELGLPPEAVGEPRPLCIVEHPGSHVSDLGLSLATGLSAEAVLAAHRAGGNAEYDQMLVVPEAGLSAFLAEVGEALVEHVAGDAEADERIRFESLTLRWLGTNRNTPCARHLHR